MTDHLKLTGYIANDQPNKNGDVFCKESLKSIADQLGGTVDPEGRVRIVHDVRAAHVEFMNQFMSNAKRRKRIHDRLNTEEDLKKFCKIRLRKKRFMKKFEKYRNRYLSDDVIRVWLGIVMIAPIREQLNYESIGRKIFCVEELPPPPAFKYALEEKYGPGQEEEKE